MVADSGRGKGGKVFKYYKCYNNKTKRICDKKGIPKNWLEDIVLAETFAMLNDEPLINRIVDAVFELQGRENTELPLLKKNLTETQKAIDNMLNAIQQGVLTSSTKERLEDLEKTKTNIEVEIMQAELKRPHFDKEYIYNWITKWRGIDIENQELRLKILDIFLNSIYDYEDEWMFMFNHKDGTKTLKKSDVDSAKTCSNLSIISPPNMR